MRLRSRILNPLADDFFTSGLFRPRISSLIFWIITFTGFALGLGYGRHADTGGRLLWGAIGIFVGFALGCAFILLSYVLFRVLVRKGWIVPPERRLGKGEK